MKGLQTMRRGYKNYQGPAFFRERGLSCVCSTELLGRDVLCLSPYAVGGYASSGDAFGIVNWKQLPSPSEDSTEMVPP